MTNRENMPTDEATAYEEITRFTLPDYFLDAFYEKVFVDLQGNPGRQKEYLHGLWRKGYLAGQTSVLCIARGNN